MIQKNTKTYDLEERTSKFSENLISLCGQLPKNVVTLPTISQLIRSGTSIGANYCEANGASSKKDFMNKIFVCKKESKGIQYWLRIIAKSITNVSSIQVCRNLWQEAKELTLIFSKIAGKSS